MGRTDRFHRTGVGFGWVVRGLAAFASGAFTVLAFAPFSVFPLAVLGPAILLLLWLDSTPGQAFREGWLFGLGLLGFGVFWMHISIDQFGNLGVAAAMSITLLFVAFMALYYGFAGWVFGYLRRSGMSLWGLLLVFPALWVLSEWVRGWLLGGFPWLSLGYSQIDSLLGGWAPLLGVYGVSLAVAASASMLVLLRFAGRRGRVSAVAGLCLIWGLGGWLFGRDWTSASGVRLQVAIVQGNISQQEKWRQEMLTPTLNLYMALTRVWWESDLVIWPETAVPAFVDEVDEGFLRPLQLEVQGQGLTLLTGIADRAADGRYYNAMIALGDGRETYYKRHLVPFGEFLPLKSLLAPLVRWMRVPMSDFAAGSGERPLLTLAGYPAGISICYEDAFGEEVIQALPEAAFLVNASNDAWFGDSLAPPQHLQIARMRALETGRYMLRATNTGISAIIGPDGGLEAVSPAFERHVLGGRIWPMQGATPYATWGNTTVVALVLALLLITWYTRNWVRKH